MIDGPDIAVYIFFRWWLVLLKPNVQSLRLVTLSRAEQCAVLDKLMPIAHRYGVQMRCCGDKGLVGYPITQSDLEKQCAGCIISLARSSLLEYMKEKSLQYNEVYK